jgi:hypothetical protein
MCCGNGAERTQHPEELFGPDWNEWGLDTFSPAKADETHIPQAPKP